MGQYELPVSFGEWLKQQRKNLDLTQNELAQRVGYSVFALRKVESGERRPSKQLAKLLAKTLDIPQEYQQTFVRVARGDLNLERLPQSLTAATPESNARGSHRPAPAPRTVNLPSPPTALVGREKELAAIARIFNTEECRLMTLTGPGGIGKTRLAIEFATRQIPAFPGGLYYVPLTSLKSAHLIVPAIADAIGMTFSGPVDTKEQLFGYLGSHTDQSLLFVLDNMEHLLAGSQTPQDELRATALIVEFLQRLPNVKFLVTSRERLNLQGEWTYEIHGLSTPPAAFEGSLEDYGASALFIQSARRASADFTVSPQEQPAIIRICRFVEGIPLAIELATGWIGVLTCTEIAQEVETNIDLLASSWRDIPSRHRSIRATFDHSWRLLTEEERDALRQLSVFNGGFDRLAADRIAGASLPVLASLVTKSLVRRTESGRYDLHELIRQYASAYLQEDALKNETQARHCRYYLAFARDREKALKSGKQQETLRELIVESDNIRAAWVCAIQSELWAPLGEAARCLGWMFEVSGLLNDGIEQFEMLIQALKKRPESAIRNRVLGQAHTHRGMLIFRKGMFDRASQLLEEALRLLRSVDDCNLLAEPLVYLGVISYLTGDLDRSRQLFDEGLVYAQNSGDRWYIAYAIFNLGHLDSLVGCYSEGYERMFAGLSIWRELGDPHSISLGINFISPSMIALGRYEEARALLEESIRLCEMTGHRWGMGTAYRFLGLAYLAQEGYLEQAKECLRKSLEVHSGIVIGWDIALSLIYLGEAAMKGGDMEGAERYYLDALGVAKEAHSMPLALDALMGLACIYARRGDRKLVFELSQYVQSHPKSSFEGRQRANRLLSEIDRAGEDPGQSEDTDLVFAELTATLEM